MTLEKEYESAKTKLNPIFQEILPKLDKELFESEGNGAAIFLKAKVDTLESKNDYSNWKRNEFESIDQDIWIASGALKNNRLVISIGQIFGNQFLEFEVKNGSIYSQFYEYYKNDKLLKLEESDVPVNELEITLEKSQVELTITKGFEIGDVIYGKSIITTRPYYLKPMSLDFEYIRREYEVLFKFKVK